MPQQQNEVFFPPPLPNSLSGEACLFTTGRVAPECGRLGLQAALDPYAQGQSDCLAASALTVRGVWALEILFLTHLLQE